MQIVRIPLKDNPLYPLPSDYGQLGRDGARAARVNACRQWMLPQKTPTLRGEALVGSLRLFDLYYLWPDEQSDFDSGFYDMPPVEAPEMHWDIVRRWASVNSPACTLDICPRGTAKSSLARKDILLELISRPRTSFMYATSTHANALYTGNILKGQFTQNSRLIDDWSVEYGRLTPLRGEAPWGADYFQLRNGSWVQTRSAESRQRGMRPLKYVLDDPEYDQKASTSMSVMRGYMDELLFTIIMPMLMRPGTACRWLATLISKSHYSWYAIDEKLAPDGTKVAKDDRFNFWSKMVIRAAYEQNGELRSCWPAMWPTEKDQAKDPGLSQMVSLESIRKRVGPRAWASEYMGRPGDSTDKYFGEVDDKKHGYSFSETDTNFAVEPWRSETNIHWFNDKGAEKVVQLKDFIRTSRTFMTVDTSFTHHAGSDFKTVCLMSITPENELFVLDLWSGQVTEDKLIREIFTMADKWKCPSIHPEVVKESAVLYHSLTTYVSTRSSEMFGVSHMPAILPVRPGLLDKGAKIGSLGPRFDYGKIKLPYQKRYAPGPWQRLFDQINEFNPEAANNGLQHDDELDCVSMSLFVLKGRLRRVLDDASEKRSALSRLKAGETMDEAGIPLLAYVDFNNLPLTEIEAIIDARREGAVNGGRRDSRA